MPFWLKNTGATFEWLVDRIFEDVIDQSIEMYVDDMVVKSTTDVEHLKNLAKVFQLLKKYELRLNPDKYSFEVQGGEFLDYVLTHRGIEANSVK